jgi:hypothetical protein
LSKLNGSKLITSIDLQHSFFQVALDELSKEATDFAVQGKGLFHFTRMPFGLHSAIATFQRLMDRVLNPVLQTCTFVYLDDIILATANFEQNLELLQEILSLLLTLV